MSQRIGVVGLLAGVASIVLGALAFASDSGTILALLAGVCGIAAGAAAMYVELQMQGRNSRIDSLERSVKDTAGQLQVVESELGDQRRAYSQSQDRLALLQARLDARSSTPSPDVEPNAGEARTLTDPETSLFSEAYFRVALDARIASARRHLRPVAIGLLEVVEGLQSDAPRRADPRAITACIRQTLRDADTACRLADGEYAIILEDTPENGAVWTIERIRRSLAAQFSGTTLWAGIACYPAHAFSTEELLDSARVALQSAREWKQDRIEVATAD